MNFYQFYQNFIDFSRKTLSSNLRVFYIIGDRRKLNFSKEEIPRLLRRLGLTNEKSGMKLKLPLLQRRLWRIQNSNPFGDSKFKVQGSKYQLFSSFFNSHCLSVCIPGRPECVNYYGILIFVNYFF